MLQLPSVFSFFPYLVCSDVLVYKFYALLKLSFLYFLQVRVASASTLASMLDGHSSTFLQLAEHKRSTKCGSFTTLSSSLGQILMQLHTGDWRLPLAVVQFNFFFLLKGDEMKVFFFFCYRLFDVE